MNAARLALASLLLLAGGCRTRPYDLGDIERPDLTVPPDLYLPPDFVPPPDLTLPFECAHVYLADANGSLYSFDTEKVEFAQLPRPRCFDVGRSVNSMAISFDYFAWISDDSGGLYKYGLRDRSCEKTAYRPNPAPGGAFAARYGMGFSRDAPGGPTETLFIADIPSAAGTDSSLGLIRMPPTGPLRIGSLGSGSPELTGTADAELWGFFPDDIAPVIARLDKTTGARLETLPLPGLEGSPSSWAFAFWGGSFWVFLQRGGDASTNVWRVDRAAPNRVELAKRDTGMRIVGAGVSTCAPIGLDN